MGRRRESKRSMSTRPRAHGRTMRIPRRVVKMSVAVIRIFTGRGGGLVRDVIVRKGRLYKGVVTM